MSPSQLQPGTLESRTISHLLMKVCPWLRGFLEISVSTKMWYHGCGTGNIQIRLSYLSVHINLPKNHTACYFHRFAAHWLFHLLQLKNTRSYKTVSFYKCYFQASDKFLLPVSSPYILVQSCGIFYIGAMQLLIFERCAQVSVIVGFWVFLSTFKLFSLLFIALWCCELVSRVPWLSWQC